MEKFNYQQNDTVIYKKARWRVWLRIWFSFIFLILYFVGVYIGLQVDFFNLHESLLSTTTLLILGGGQLFLYLILLLMLSTGSKIFRIFYWICYFFEVLLIGLPSYYLYEDISHFLVYGILIFCMMIKLIFLYSLGSFLHHNKWSKVFFDYVLEVEEEQEGPYEDEIFQPIQNTYAQTKRQPQPPIEEYEMEEEPEPYTLPQISVRLGICVYASLMVFPILVQIFSSFFVSNDLQTVFATKDIFILCIITAVIWTIPVFFLYYSHPYSKRILLGCALAECIATAAFMPRFIGYITSGDYPIRVFILFVLVDILRYVILYIALKPVAKV